MAPSTAVPLENRDDTVAELRRQLHELRSINELQGGAAAERCLKLSDIAQPLDKGLACQSLQLAYWAFMVRGDRLKAKRALERSASIARRWKLPALQARCTLMRIEMLMAVGEHLDGFSGLGAFIKTPLFQQLSVNDTIRAYFLLAWGCRLTEPGYGVEACFALAEAKRRERDAPLAPMFVLWRALFDIQRVLWSSPFFESLLAGRVTSPVLLHKSRQRLLADCSSLTQLDPKYPENRHPKAMGAIVDSLFKAVDTGGVEHARKASTELNQRVTKDGLGHYSQVDFGYLVASTLMIVGCFDLAQIEMQRHRELAAKSDMWEMQIFWPHLESLLAAQLGKPNAALEHYHLYAQRHTRQLKRMDLATGKLLRTLTELPGARPADLPHSKPEYLLHAADILAKRTKRLGVQELADAVGVSERTLREAFQVHLNATPSEYALRIRLDRANEFVRAGGAHNKSLAEVAELFDFSNPSRFSSMYRARFGQSPTKQGKP